MALWHSFHIVFLNLLLIYKKSNIILSFTSLSNNSCLQIVSTVGFFDYLVCESAELCSKSSANTHEPIETAIHQVGNLNLFEIYKYMCVYRIIEFIIDNYNIRLQIPNNSQLVQQRESEDNESKNYSTAGRHNSHPKENNIQIDDNHRQKEPWSYLELNQNGMIL